jgi:predicted porin
MKMTGDSTMQRCLSAVLAATLLGAAAAAQAQPSGVTLFGLIDAGVETIDHVGPGNARVTRLPSLTGTVSSRLGVRAREDLGGGYGVTATLELGFAPDTGSLLQGARVFGRQSLVGLDTPLGSFAVGRQYTMLLWSILDADVLGPNLYGTGSLDAGIPNARTDNTLSWRHAFAGWSLGATYSLGRDPVNAGPSPSGTNCPGESATDARACRAWSLMAKYDAPRWGFAVADDRQHGRALTGAGDAIFGGLDSSAKVDRRVSVNGYVRDGQAKLSLGLVRRDNDGDAVKPRSNLWYVGAAWPLSTNWLLDGSWMTLRYRGVAGHGATLYGVRATYSLSRRTALYVQGARIDNEALSARSVSAGAAGSSPLAGRTQTALNAGIRHAF